MKLCYLFQIFDSALEDVEEFGGFGDFMCSFNLLRGKKTEDEDDEERRFSGKFKVWFTLHFCELFENV